MLILFALITAVSCLCLVASERGDSRIGVSIFKGIASSAFVGAGIAAGAFASGYGRLVLLALAFSWLGDLLLIPKNRRHFFLLGMASFLLAHLAYCAAFISRGISTTAIALASAAMAVVALALYRWLGPSLSGAFKFAVPAYILAISCMTVLAASASAIMRDPLPLVGAILFAASDAAVARDRFVAPAWPNRAVGLPLYYAAQLLMAMTALR